MHSALRVVIGGGWLAGFLLATGCGDSGSSGPPTIVPDTLSLRAEFYDSLTREELPYGSVNWDFNGVPGPEATVVEGDSGVVTVQSDYYADPHFALNIPFNQNGALIQRIPLLPTGLSILRATWLADSNQGVFELTLRYPDGLANVVVDSMNVRLFLCTSAGNGGNGYSCIDTMSTLPFHFLPPFEFVPPLWEASWNGTDTTGHARISFMSPTWVPYYYFPAAECGSSCGWTLGLELWLHDSRQRTFPIGCGGAIPEDTPLSPPYQNCRDIRNDPYR